MGMVFCGIDPGITGALVVLPDLGEIEFYDTPTTQVKSGKKLHNQMDAPAIRIFLSDILARHGKDLFAVIEKVTPMPSYKTDDPTAERRTMGATSAFNFGKGVGVWIGLLAGLQIPYEEVHPKRWKNLMLSDMGKEKDASRVKAMQTYPQTAKHLSLKKHHGRADALLMAAYLKRTHVWELGKF